MGTQIITVLSGSLEVNVVLSEYRYRVFDDIGWLKDWPPSNMIGLDGIYGRFERAAW